MKPNPLVASLIAVPAGLLITMMFLWLFAIDIITLEKLAMFPESWSILDFISNAFALVMFGGATRAIYRMVMGKYDEQSKQERDQDTIPFDH
jgi:hypothetical protein